MREPKDKRVCRCECGGWVRGVHTFGRLFTYCDKCTPVVTITCNTVFNKGATDARPGQ